MKARLKRLLVWIVIFAMMMQMGPLEPLQVLAAISVSTTTEITEDVNDDVYVATSGDGQADNITITVSQGVTVSGSIMDTGIASSEGDSATIVNYGTITGAFVANAGFELSNYGTMSSVEVNAGTTTLNGGTINNLTLYEAGALQVNATSTVSNFLYSAGANGGGGSLNGNGTLAVISRLDLEATLASAVPIRVNSDTMINSVDEAMVYDENGMDFVIPAGTTNGTLNSMYGYEYSTDSIAFSDKYVGYDTVSSKSFTVTNTGSLDQEFTYDFDTSGVFDVEVTGVTDGVLAAGASATFTVTPKMDLEVGTYEDLIMVSITNREISVPLMFEVLDKIVSEGSVDMPDFYYGEAVPAYTMQCGSHKLKNAVIRYKEKGASDETLSENVPTEVGKYVIKVTFAETKTVKAMVLKDTFQISYLPAPENPFVVTGTKGDNDFYRSAVTITPAEGYQVAQKLNGTYVDALEIGSSQTPEMLYLKSEETGAMTAGIALENIKIDAVLPAFSGAESGSVYYGDSVDISVMDLNLSRLTVNGEEVALDGQVATVNLSAEHGVKEYRLIAEDLAGNSKMFKILVAAEWTKDGIVPSGQLVRLEKAKAYKFSEGVWHIAGDDTNYAGGNTFYVGSDGEYTFTKE